MEDLLRKNLSPSHPSLSVLPLHEFGLSTIDKGRALSCRELTFTMVGDAFIMCLEQEARILLTRFALAAGHPYRTQRPLVPSVAVNYGQ